MKSKIDFEFEGVAASELNPLQNMILFFLAGKVAALDHDPVYTNEVLIKVQKHKGDSGVWIKFNNIRIEFIRSCLKSLPKFIEERCKQLHTDLGSAEKDNFTKEKHCGLYLDAFDMSVSIESIRVINFSI